jgi:2-polyprenyl-3-methyl-5-hydroxy-6-metoxy-1,4-benzoquinol methylase
VVDLETRSEEKELMDDLSAGGHVIDQTLHELDIINKFLGGNQITINGIKSLYNGVFPDKFSIADLGCGSGEMLANVQRWALKNNIETNLMGIDANPNVIKYAKHKHGELGIEFLARNIFEPLFAKRRFDVILATLFTHHFTNNQLVFLIQQWFQQVSTGIVINDLHRHALAYKSIAFLTKSFSKSNMVIEDAPLSVARGFLKNDWEEILEGAGIKNYTLRWRWAFRWELIIFKN